MTIRQRKFLTDTFKGARVGQAGQTFMVYSSQYTSSDGHPTWLLGEGDVGGAFFTQGSTAHFDVPTVAAHWSNYRGPLFPKDGFTSNFGNQRPSGNKPSSVLQLSAAGTTAIARVLPTNPYAGVATFLGEAREGMPRMFGSGLLKERARLLRGSGSEYLNLEFGWKPLVSDLRKFSVAVKDSNRILEQFRKDAGRKIRRRYEFPADVVQTVSVDTSTYPGALDGGFNALDVAARKLTTTDIITTKRWFSGAFRYAIPMGDDLVSRFQRFEAEANKLLGTRLTPEVVWNLAPWSWAADWFTNTGDVFHNISAMSADGLAMQYGYIMEQKTMERRLYQECRIRPPGDPWGSGIPFTSLVIFTDVCKTRYAATPFGFGLNVDSFTPRQIAIAASIGVTRRK